MTWMQTLSGKKFSLIDPRPEDVDFVQEVAPALGKLARFCGATRGLYSVAQHCVVGADGLYVYQDGQERKAKRLAALFLLHDAHEAYIGDITTPVVAALDYQYLDPKKVVSEAVRKLKGRLDAAIHYAAGVALPTAEEHRIIKDWDARMMIAERNALMATSPEPWWSGEIEPAPVDVEDLEILDPDYAGEAWLDAYHCYIGPFHAR